MGKNKLIAIILSIAVMLTVFANSCIVSALMDHPDSSSSEDESAVSSLALSDPVISSANATGKSGKTVKVTFSVKDNVGFTNMNLGISYNSKILTFAYVSNLTTASGVEVSTENTDVLDVILSDLNEDTARQQVFSITFKIKGGIYSETTLPLSVSRATSMNAERNVVNVKAVGSSIKITPDDPPPPETSSTESTSSTGGTSSTEDTSSTPDAPMSVELNLSKTSQELFVGELYDVLPLIMPNTIDKSKLTFQSDHTKIASVTAKGQVVAIKEGNTVITVKSSESDSVLRLNISVKPDIPVSEILFYDSEITIAVGETKIINALVVPEDATQKKIVFESSDSKIAAFDNKGNLKGIKEGIIYITVTSANGVVSNKCVVNVVAGRAGGDLTSVSGKIISVDKQPISNYTLQLISNDVEATTDKNGAFQFPKIVSGHDVLCLKELETGKIIATGTVVIRNKNNIKVQVVLNDNVLSVQDITDVAVPVTNIDLSEKKVTLHVDGVYQLFAIAMPKDATNQVIAFKSSDEKIATVANDGTITAVDAGECKIIASSADGLINSICTLTVELVQSRKYSFLIILIEIVLIVLFLGVFIIKYRKYKSKETFEE